jgi:hypothetical protein
MMSEPVLQGVPGLEIIVFQWARKHGDCDDCGLPAAFKIDLSAFQQDAGFPERQFCAVCAANAAADGERIERIEEIT